MVSNLELQNKIAILLVSHGSSLPFAEVTFNEIKDKFNKATGFATEVGYMKVAEPSIAGAVENLKEEVPELEKIIAIPVFLAPGIHTNIDIPTLLGLSPRKLILDVLTVIILMTIIYLLLRMLILMEILSYCRLLDQMIIF